MSGNKAPASLTAMESQLKKCEKEVVDLEKQYNDVINKMSSNQAELEFAKGTGDAKQISLLNGQQSQLDSQSVFLATQLEDAKDKAEKLKQSLDELKINPQSSMEVQNLKAKIDLAEQSLNNSKQEANDLGKKIEKIGKSRFGKLGIDASTIKNGFEQINSKLDKFKNKMTRLISTVMIFSLLRKGLTSLSNGLVSLLKSNATFANSLNQIKVNLMTAFAPIYNSILPAINALMNALAKITGTIAVFINSLFGKTADQAKKNAKALYDQAKATKKVKQEQDSLGSFDKLEVNNDNNDSNTGSGAGGQDLDFSGEISYSQKLLDILNGLKDFVLNNKEELLGLLGGLIGGLLAIKFHLDALKALGIGILIYGLITLISSIISYLNDPSWENFGNVIKAIGAILLGFGIIIGSIPLAVAGAIAMILGLIISNWETIKEFFQNIIQWIYDHLDEIKDKFGIVGVFISTIFANILQWFIYTFDEIFSGIKEILDGIIDLVAGVFTGNWERAWNGIQKIVSGVFKSLLGIVKAPLNGIIALLNGIIDGLNYLINGINKISIDIPDWVPAIGGKKLGFNIPKIGKIPMLAQGAVIPPNKQFMAVLGDQKNGTNLEAPENLIRKIIREESGEKQVILNATFIMQCETEEIGRAALKGIHLLENIDGQEYVLN